MEYDLRTEINWTLDTCYIIRYRIRSLFMKKNFLRFKILPFPPSESLDFTRKHLKYFTFQQQQSKIVVFKLKNWWTCIPLETFVFPKLSTLYIYETTNTLTHSLEFGRRSGTEGTGNCGTTHFSSVREINAEVLLPPFDPIGTVGTRNASKW